MKVVVNRGFGGFDLDKASVDLLLQCGVQMPGWYGYEKDFRTNDILVAIVTFNNARARHLGTEPTGLVILDIPDDATDWMIVDYDGAERIIYVLDGKLHEIDPDDVYEEEEEHESD